MNAMMCIVGVIYLLVAVVVKLVMVIHVKKIASCLNNIVNYKFGNQYIYYSLCNVYIQHNNLLCNRHNQYS